MNNIKSIRVAASVILYNSSDKCLVNIETYSHQVEKVYIIDNSEIPNACLVESLKALPRIVYIANGENKGVAYGLNLAARLALNHGFHYLLTMDDDTQVPLDAVKDMLTFLTVYEHAEKVGILSANHAATINVEHIYFRPVLTTMTSGNLLNLTIFHQVGPFRDDFFVDHVDHEYCLRLNSLGFLVIELPNIRLDHKLGTLKFYPFNLGKFVSHSPLRIYYIIRNGVVLINIYRSMFPSYICKLRSTLFREVIKSIFLDERKLERLKLIWLGWQHGKKGHLGKFGK